MALTFNLLLDTEINPFAAYHIRTALDCFNNNILTEEQFATWDELNGCDIFERMEVLGGVEDAEMANPEM